MIEAVIVISTMLVFFGLIVFVKKAYSAKLDLQQQTRANVLYYASHGCPGKGGVLEGTAQVSAGNDRISVSGSTAEGVGSPHVDTVAGKSTMPSASAMGRTWNTAHAAAVTLVAWYAVWDSNAKTEKGGAIKLRPHALTKAITAFSSVSCNEKKYDDQWTAWYEFASDFLTRGFGGAGDLFK